MKKRYKLLKDLPGLCEGAEFVCDDLGENSKCVVWNGTHKFNKNYFNNRPIPLALVDDNPEWFQELTEEEEIEMPETTFFALISDDCYVNLHPDWKKWAQQVTNTLNSLTKEGKK